MHGKVKDSDKISGRSDERLCNHTDAGTRIYKTYPFLYTTVFLILRDLKGRTVYSSRMEIWIIKPVEIALIVLVNTL